jgi:hypothetical protein
VGQIYFILITTAQARSNMRKLDYSSFIFLFSLENIYLYSPNYKMIYYEKKKLSDIYAVEYGCIFAERILYKQWLKKTDAGKRN